MLTRIRYLFGIDDPSPWDRTNTFRLKCALSILLRAPTQSQRLAHYEELNIASLDEGTIEELIEWVISPHDGVRAYHTDIEAKRMLARRRAERESAPLFPVVDDSICEERVCVFIAVMPSQR